MNGIFFIAKDGSVIGHTDKSKINALPWYKRLWAKINKSYRNKYIDIKPFKCELWKEKDEN